MSFSVEFHRAAREEFIEAAVRYEAERSNLGAEFIEEVERCVVLAAERPKTYAVVHANTRRISARRFPYCIYFRTENTRIVVLAVFHARRNPAVWKSRA